MAAYYNENDQLVAMWLRELIKAGLIADGEVDERSIADVSADDLRGFVQCHFFAGIGGWSYALRLAGWPDDRAVWTGSCPCQASSSATHGRSVAREWWPEWQRLLAIWRPAVVFGEQVVRASWVDLMAADLEHLGYRVGAAILPAFCVGHDHRRERVYFAGDTDRHGEPSLPLHAKVARLSRDRRDTERLGAAHGVSRDVVALSGFGNAIVPQVAQVFIEAYMSLNPRPSEAP